MQSRKTLLFSNTDIWAKKTGNEDFDVPMGCFDGAEVCELIGTFLLNLLNRSCGAGNMGLYRDDGLGILHNKSGPQTERIKKEIIKLFKDNNLKITIDAGLKIVNFLDVTLDLNNDLYKPYTKPNSKLMYINSNSNHPPSLIEKIPTMVSKRLSDLSKNEEVFKQAVPPYEEALRTSGYSQKLSYTQKHDHEQKKRNRKRNIIWFNPPYSKSVETKIGKIFLQLIDKHFPPGKIIRDNKELHKIFNRNNVKVSSSCLRNIGSIISSHNKILLKTENESYGCNCRNKNDCPLQEKCLTPGVIYKSNVKSNNEENKYIGMTLPPFKTRWRNHKTDFKTESRRNATELSKHIWTLKEKDQTSTISYEILKLVKMNYASHNFCRLCLTEKVEIMEHLDDPQLLNSRDEFVTKCRHQNAFLLKNWKAGMETKQVRRQGIG